MSKARKPVSRDRAQGEVGAAQRQGPSGRPRHSQPRHPPVHGGDVQARHAARRGRSARQPDRGRGFHRQPRRNAVPGRATRRAPGVLARSAASWSTRRSTRSRRRCARSRRPDGHGSPIEPPSEDERQQFLLVDARTVPAAGRRPALGRARRDSGAPGQRRARLLPDRSHRCRAPIGAARGGGAPSLRGVPGIGERWSWPARPS